MAASLQNIQGLVTQALEAIRGKNTDDVKRKFWPYIIDELNKGDPSEWLVLSHLRVKIHDHLDEAGQHATEMPLPFNVEEQVNLLKVAWRDGKLQKPESPKITWLPG